ncbi:MAG: alpha/beta hydrolase [Gammaproteobacteria bacterium]
MSLLLSLVLIYLGVCLALFLGQRRLIYFPQPEVKSESAEAVWIPSGTETLKLWRVNSGRTQAIVYFGGNAEEVSRNIPDYADWFPDATIYFANYRGYGGSTGQPSEAALFADAVRIFDQLAPRYQDIAVVGRSLGSGVAVYLASQRPVQRLVLVTPFDSVARIARRMFPVLPTSLLLQDRFDSVSRVPQVAAPVLVVVAAEDGVITRPHSDALVAAFPANQLSIELIPEADHNTIHLWPAYAQSLRDFL